MASDQPVVAATQLPEGLEPYSRTASFTEETLPAGLRKDHTTKAGSWGLIRVEQGVLRYRVTDPRRVASDQELAPDTSPGVVEPTILHHVEPVGPVRFHVEFLREATIPLCRHERLAEQENRTRSRR
jgi:tellurite resistance-related uncharacterized protein